MSKENETLDIYIQQQQNTINKLTQTTLMLETKIALLENQIIDQEKEIDRHRANTEILEKQILTQFEEIDKYRNKIAFLMRQMTSQSEEIDRYKFKEEVKKDKQIDRVGLSAQVQSISGSDRLKSINKNQSISGSDRLQNKKTIEKFSVKKVSEPHKVEKKSKKLFGIFTIKR
jgi:hypothetical protein